MDRKIHRIHELLLLLLLLLLLYIAVTDSLSTRSSPTLCFRLDGFLIWGFLLFLPLEGLIVDRNSTHSQLLHNLQKSACIGLFGDAKMVKKGNIANYRERLDDTLASDNLIDEKKLKTLVKDQILRSMADNKAIDNIDYITEKRTLEVSNFLEMLRSASENYNAPSHETHHTTWKLKQDTEDFRVMYREGPVGSPFHSLLVEGYIDAPLDACLCVSWESTLYPRWFPETLIPTFKVAEAKKLQKVRIGEEISLVRVKLSWPLSSREALLHYFEFEYFENDLVVVLLNTISNADNIQNETHGFTNEGIPEADNTVRIDLVGGFALQKVTESRSYFRGSWVNVKPRSSWFGDSPLLTGEDLSTRTIGNLDIKLDFVPPSLINFISRQLIGSGFRFYKKTVASVSNGDEAFAKVLSDPLYSRIRQALYSKSESKRSLMGKQTIPDYTGINDGKQKTNVQNASRKEDEKILSNDNFSKPSEGSKPISNEIEEEAIKESNGHVSGYLMQDKFACEIEEEGVEGSENENVNNIKDAKESRGSIDQPQSVDFHNNVPISPQVERALGTLDKLINVVKENRRKGQNGSQSGPKIGEGAAISSTLGKQMNWVDKQGTSVEENDKATAHVSRNDLGTDNMRSEKSDLQAQEENSQVIPPDQNPAIANWSIHAPSAGNSPVAGLTASSMNREANGIHEDKKKTGQQKKWRLCCFHIPSARLVS